MTEVPESRVENSAFTVVAGGCDSSHSEIYVASHRLLDTRTARDYAVAILAACDYWDGARHATID